MQFAQVSFTVTGELSGQAWAVQQAALRLTTQDASDAHALTKTAPLSPHEATEAVSLPCAGQLQGGRGVKGASLACAAGSSAAHHAGQPRIAPVLSSSCTEHQQSSVVL